MRILHIDTAGTMGGGQRLMFSLVHSLSETLEMHVCIPQGVFLDAYKGEKNITTHTLPFFVIRQLFALFSLLRSTHFDIVHCHGIRSAFLVRWLSIFFVRHRMYRIVFTVHGFHIGHKRSFFRPLLVFVERYLARHTDAVVCVSDDDKNMLAACGIQASVIHNGITPAVVSQKTYADPGSPYLLVSISRLAFPKDVATTIAAIDRLVHVLGHHDIHLSIVGDGPQRHSLEQQVRALQLEEYVSFLGIVNTIEDVISCADLCILSSAWEGEPLSILEAMMYQVPIIASDVHGVRSLVTHRQSGLLFTYQDPKMLSEMIVEMRTNNQLRRACVEYAYQHVMRFHTIETMTQSYLSLYETVAHK